MGAPKEKIEVSSINVNGAGRIRKNRCKKKNHPNKRWGGVPEYNLGAVKQWLVWGNAEDIDWMMCNGWYFLGEKSWG